MVDYSQTENNKFSIISEGIGDNVKNDLKSLFDFLLEVIQKSQRYFELNVRFLITWGASLGGMIMPLNQWMKGEFKELTEQQIILLTVGIACNYFYDNEKFIKNIIDKIKQEGLLGYFQKLYSKSEELKDTFFNFMESISILGRTMTNIMSYAFILPVLDDIIHIANSENVDQSINDLVMRITASGVVMITGMTLSTFIKKLVQHFKSERVSD